MRQHSLNKLEYPRAIAALMNFAVTYLGKKRIEQLQPMTDIEIIRRKLAETEEACRLLARGAHPPVPSLEGMETLTALLGTGYVLTEQDFGHLAQFARSCEQLQQYLAAKKTEFSSVAGYGMSMYDLKPLRESIEACVDRGASSIRRVRTCTRFGRKSARRKRSCKRGWRASCPSSRTAYRRKSSAGETDDSFCP